MDSRYVRKTDRSSSREVTDKNRSADLVIAAVQSLNHRHRFSGVARFPQYLIINRYQSIGRENDPLRMHSRGGQRLARRIQSCQFSQGQMLFEAFGNGRDENFEVEPCF